VGNLQLRIEDTGVWFDNGDCAVESWESEESILRAHDGGQVQSQVLWVHVGGEAERQALLLAGWYLDGILVGCQVANNARRGCGIRSPQTATDELDSNGVGLFIGEGENRLSLLAIDQLDAEDFSIGEAGFDSDGDCRSL
jgi:hypothetical protein